MINAELQLSKVRMLAERRARHQDYADFWLKQIQAAGENYRRWMAEIKQDDAEMRHLASEREP